MNYAERSQSYAKVHEAFDFNVFLYVFLNCEKSFNPSAAVRIALILSRKMAEGFKNQILQTLQPSSQILQQDFPPANPGFRRTNRRFENPVAG
ncbi:MAG: hypothetical protein SPK03_04280, partial [Alloprevotella sp.]|nr:hypothetical protein [Alloprevotella sp.]